jgi:hypothetical protein
MSFREKSDWCSFLSLCVFGFFFFQLAHDFLTYGHPPRNYFALFFGLAGLMVAIQVVSHVGLVILSPKDAEAPVDERERLIHLRAVRVSYYVLLVGVFLVIGTMHLGFSIWQMAHCILFVIWLAELVRYGLRLFFHRREA